MLDFYLINDNIVSPEFPEEIGLEFAGGLESKIFSDIKKHGLIDDRLSFYSDFHLTSEQVKQIFNAAIKSSIDKDTSVTQFRHILKKAIEKGSGLIAYCD